MDVFLTCINTSFLDLDVNISERDIVDIFVCIDSYFQVYPISNKQKLRDLKYYIPNLGFVD